MTSQEMNAMQPFGGQERQMPEGPSMNGNGASPRRRTRPARPRIAVAEPATRKKPATSPASPAPAASASPPVRPTRRKRAPVASAAARAATPEEQLAADAASFTVAAVPEMMSLNGSVAPAPPTPSRLDVSVIPPVQAAMLGTPESAALRRSGGISPENTVFVSLSFEGPDAYSMAGGLGARVTEFTEALAEQGYDTHLIFVGDPGMPGSEERVNGKLHLVRWSQWISKYYPNGVYEGEEHKLHDYDETVPYYVFEQIARPAIEQGKIVVIIGEDWHTAEAVSRTSDLLHWHNLRHRSILMWNCNSVMSLHRINWGRLNYTATITTVSRYMKHRLWEYGVNPLVIPNGIPRRYLDAVDAEAAHTLREIMQRGNPERQFLFKIGRFDPDKRWLMAVEAAAHLKYSGHPMAMVIRGGIEPHGVEVLARARSMGLHVRDIEARRPTPEECMQLLREAGEADIYNLRFFVPEEFVRLCYASADATLANSGHEPFGLVGLEVMAAGGIAFTGSTGEDYAISFENAVALETEDPEEIVGYLLHLTRHPEEREKIRAEGRRTAAAFTWEDAIVNMEGKLGYLARKQSMLFD